MKYNPIVFLPNGKKWEDEKSGFWYRLAEFSTWTAVMIVAFLILCL
jgi:hypothetical protein